MRSITCFPSESRSDPARVSSRLFPGPSQGPRRPAGAWHLPSWCGMHRHPCPGTPSLWRSAFMPLRVHPPAATGAHCATAPELSKFVAPTSPSHMPRESPSAGRLVRGCRCCSSNCSNRSTHPGQSLLPRSRPRISRLRDDVAQPSFASPLRFERPVLPKLPLASPSFPARRRRIAVRRHLRYLCVVEPKFDLLACARYSRLAPALPRARFRQRKRI